MTIQTPGQAWSFTQPVDRFEVRPGDRWPGDPPTSERCELVGDTQPFDTDVWLTMNLRITADAVDAPWTVLGQFRATEDTNDYKSRSPVFAQEAYHSPQPGCCRLQIVTRGAPDDPSTSNTTGTVRYHTDRFTLGDWHTLRHRIRFSPGAAGHLDSWLDGQQVITGLSAPIGYADKQGPRWKHGIYRATGSVHPLVVEYADLTISG